MELREVDGPTGGAALPPVRCRFRPPRRPRGGGRSSAQVEFFEFPVERRKSEPEPSGGLALVVAAPFENQTDVLPLVAPDGLPEVVAGVWLRRGRGRVGGRTLDQAGGEVVRREDRPVS